jgi:gliding motility-associated-like protein
VDVNPAPTADAGSDENICEGSTVTLQGSGGSTYLWSPASSLSDSSIAAPVASPTDTTTYLLTVSNGQCKAYDQVTVFVWKKPTADAGPDQKIFEGDPAQLAGIAGGSDVTYAWTPVYNITDATILDPIVTPDSDTTYTLTVVSGDGCGSASDKVFIRVYKKIIIPNAFSPNNDGINDTWHIAKLDTYPEADVSVFNRYGQLVFKSRGYANEWKGTYDGKPLPVGTYYYVIDLKTGFGKNPTGWVVILR